MLRKKSKIESPFAENERKRQQQINDSYDRANAILAKHGMKPMLRRGIFALADEPKPLKVSKGSRGQLTAENLEKEREALRAAKTGKPNAPEALKMSAYSPLLELCPSPSELSVEARYERDRAYAQETAARARDAMIYGDLAPDVRRKRRIDFLLENKAYLNNGLGFERKTLKQLTARDLRALDHRVRDSIALVTSSEPTPVPVVMGEHLKAKVIQDEHYARAKAVMAEIARPLKPQQTVVKAEPKAIANSAEAEAIAKDVAERHPTLKDHTALLNRAYALDRADSLGLTTWADKPALALTRLTTEVAELNRQLSLVRAVEWANEVEQAYAAPPKKGWFGRTKETHSPQYYVVRLEQCRKALLAVHDQVEGLELRVCAEVEALMLDMAVLAAGADRMTDNGRQTLALSRYRTLAGLQMTTEMLRQSLEQLRHNTASQSTTISNLMTVTLPNWIMALEAKNPSEQTTETTFTSGGFVRPPTGRVLRR